MAGIDDTGFVLKTFEEIVEEINDDQKSLFGDQFNTAADSAVGQLTQIFGDKLASLWELAELIYRSQDPSAATGDALDNIGKITGTTRKAATSTVVTVTVDSTAGTTVTAGDTIEDSSGNVYEATSTVVIPAGTPTDVSYSAQDTGPITALGGRVFRNVSSPSLDSVNATLTSSGTEPFNIGPTETLEFSVAGRPNQTVTLVGPASLTAADLAVEIETQLGNVTASDSGGAVEIEITLPDPDALGNSLQFLTSTSIGFPTAISYGSPANQKDGSPGTDVESDSEYRERRQDLVQASGLRTLEAIRDAVLTVSGTLTAFILENDTDFTDSEGLPPHSFEVVITSTFDQAGVTAEDLQYFEDVATVILARKGLSVQTYTGATGNDRIEHVEADTSPTSINRPQIFDSQGFGKDISYSVATDIPITDMNITLVTNSEFGAGVEANGQEEIRTAITAYIAGLSTGDDLVYNQLLCAILDVTGVTDVTAITFDIPAKGVSGGSANVVIGFRELLSLQSSVIDFV